MTFISCDTTEVVSALQKLRSAWKGRDFQILSAVKGGRGGIRAINAEYHAQACNDPFDSRLMPGEPIIHLVNDYDRGLMNGTLGHVVAVHEDHSIEFSFEGGLHTLSADEVRDRIDLAYAISVHKAQGSQFAKVAVVIAKSPLLDHAMVYTALTRGVEQVVFVGDQQAFVKAVESEPLAHLRSVAFEV